MMPSAADYDEPLLIELLRWAAAPRGSVLGFCDVRIEGALVVHERPLCRSGDRIWMTFPARPLIDASGNLFRNEMYQAVWTPLLSWENRVERDHFSVVVIDAIQSQYPGALPKNCRFIPLAEDKSKAGRNASRSAQP